MNFFKVFINLFTSKPIIDLLTQDIDNQKKAMDEFIENYKSLLSENDSLNSFKKKVGCSAGILYWEKNKQHRYVYANEMHCNMFFDIAYKNVNLLIGKTDKQLIKQYRENGEHTFGELCVSTDEYIETNLKKARFFEFGYKKGLPLLLDVTKEPLFDEFGGFTGTKGYAIDLSSRETDAVALIEIFLKKKIAVRLDKGTHKQVAAYLVNDRRQQFNRVFPE